MWDLRQFQSKEPVAIFKHHTEPVTTVEWHPTEATIFASGGADNQIALWDLSVEKDTEANEEEIKVFFRAPYLLRKMTITFFVSGYSSAVAFHSSRTDRCKRITLASADTWCYIEYST